MPVTMNGIELLFFTTTDKDGNTIVRNAFNVLEELYQNIETGQSVGDISTAIKPLQDGQNHLLTKTAEIGGRIRRLDLLEARYEQDEINYKRMRSDSEDADMAEVIMNQKMAEAVYQAALSAGARIIQPTLMDFLR
jgi:flagellar hook-associated protein 3 FlgL